MGMIAPGVKVKCWVSTGLARSLAHGGLDKRCSPFTALPRHSQPLIRTGTTLSTVSLSLSFPPCRVWEWPSQIPVVTRVQRGGLLWGTLPVGHGSPPPPHQLGFVFLLPFLPTQTGLASWSPLQAHADLGRREGLLP